MTRTSSSAPWLDPLRTIFALVVVSLGAAAFAMAFRAALSFVYERVFRAHDVLSAFEGLPPLARIALPTAGAFLAGLVVRVAASKGEGVSDVMEAVVLGRVRLSIRATTFKAIASWFAIATGGSIGREGPLIQFGGSLGASVASFARLSGSSTRALIAAGTAAGFAAAYNTPLAAVLFVVEVVIGVVAIRPLVMVLIATAISTALVRELVGAGPIYGQRTFTITTTSELVAHAGLGVVAGIAAVAFMHLLALGERGFGATALGQPWRATVGGLLVGLVACGLPQVAGNGYEPLNQLLDQRYSVSFIAIIVIAKALTTTSSVASGSPGGVFTPSLLIGGGLGMLWGVAVAKLTGATGSEGTFALVGMAAMTAATTHAPLMACVLVFELTDDYAIVLPLVLATAIATLVSRRLHRASIYTAELRRRGIAWDVSLEGGRTAPPSAAAGR